MAELIVGLTTYFEFYNYERPHQSLGYTTPDLVYRTSVGGGAVIIDKYPHADVEVPVERSGTGASTTAKEESKAKPVHIAQSEQHRSAEN